MLDAAVLGDGVQRIVEGIFQAVFHVAPPIGMGAGLELRVFLADADRQAIDGNQAAGEDDSGSFPDGGS